MYADYGTVQIKEAVKKTFPYSPVADPGERPGGSVPSLFLDQTEARGPPPLSQDLDDHHHPPPPYLKVWISHCSLCLMHFNDLCVWTVNFFPIQETPLVSIYNSQQQAQARQCATFLPDHVHADCARDEWCSSAYNETIAKAYPYSLFSFDDDELYSCVDVFSWR